MITNARKESFCKANIELLELIWRIGKGLMYKKHIEAYMEHFFGQKPQDTWEKLKELEGADIVQRVRLYNIVVIKLKKYALRFLMGVERERIRSIEVTASKLMRNAYINAVILHHLKVDPIITKLDYQRFLDRYYPYSTFFVARNQAYQVLSRLYVEKGLFFTEIEQEIDRLKEIQVRSLSFSKKERGNKYKEKEVAEYTFNINSMEQGSVFIDYTTKKEGIHIAILDDKNNLSGGKIAEKIMRTYSYFYDFLPFGTLFKFTVYVRNEERVKALKNNANMKAYNDFISTKSRIQGFTWHGQNVDVKFVNLDLDRQLFGNQSLALTGSVNSKKQRKFEEEE